MSPGVVNQFDTDHRITAFPCHDAPPAQQVPSAWTAEITACV